MFAQTERRFKQGKSPAVDPTVVSNYGEDEDSPHTLLAACGAAPMGIGAPCDVVDAGIYAFEGDLKGVTLSLAGVLPIFGSDQASSLARGARITERATDAGGGGRAAARGADDIAKPTMGALTRQQDAALNAALRDPNKLHKIFDAPKHKLDPLVQELGSREAVLREAVLAVPRSQTGVFEVTTQLGRHSLTVRGRVVNDVPRISTAFVP